MQTFDCHIITLVSPVLNMLKPLLKYHVFTYLRKFASAALISPPQWKIGRKGVQTENYERPKSITFCQYIVHVIHTVL